MVTENGDTAASVLPGNLLQVKQAKVEARDRRGFERIVMVPIHDKVLSSSS